MKKILVTVKTDGTIQTDFQGFDGNCCFEEDAKLKAALLRTAGIDLGDPLNIQCKIGATPLQPRAMTKTGT